MKKVIEYCVVSTSPAFQFQAEVNQKLKEGWQLHGGLSTIFIQDAGAGYSQALVKYQEDAETGTNI